MTDVGPDLAGLSSDQAALLDHLLAEAARERTPETPPTGPRAVCIQAGGDDPPLFLIHGSGGQVMFLHALARHMAPAQPVYGIEAGAVAETADAIAAYLEVVRSVRPTGPYRLGAYSAGCLIAFEIAGRLIDAGEHVEALVLIDPVGLSWRGEATQPPPDSRGRLSWRFEAATLAGVTPLSAQFGQIEQANRVLAKVAAGFDPRSLDLPIRILRGLRGPYVATPEVLSDWAALSLKGLEQAAIDATHFDIVREPHAGAAGRQIQAWLDAFSMRA